MGNLQINSYTFQIPTWVFLAIHGTREERPVAVSRKCTKSASSKWEDQRRTLKSRLIACTWSELWVAIRNSAPSVLTTVTSVGLVKVLLVRPESSTSFTTPPPTNWSYQDISQRCHHRS